MQPSTSAGRERSLIIVSKSAGAAVALIGAAVFLSWLIGRPWLTYLVPGLATMKANTALAFLFGGAALFLLNPARTLAVRVLALAILALALATLIEHVFGWNPGIDVWFTADPASALAGAAPGRMAPATAAGFLLLALALLSVEAAWQRPSWPVQWLAAAVGLNALIAVLGYVYGAEALYHMRPYSSMAVHTAASFLLLALGIVLARPRLGVMGRVIADDAGGLLLRRLLPPAVLLPIFVGSAALIGFHLGLYESEFGTALLASAQIVILSLLIWWTASAVRSSDTDRQRATDALLDSESRLRTVIDSSLTAVVTIDLDGHIIEWNRRAEVIFGWTRSEALGRELATLIIAEVHRERHREGLRRFAATGQAKLLNRAVELPALRKDGSEFPAEIAITAFDSAGRTTVCGFINDVSERRFAEGKVRAQLARLDLLNRITRAIGERQDLRSIFQVVLLRLEQDMPIDLACVCLHDANADSVTVTSIGNHGKDVIATTGLAERSQIPIDRNGLGRCMAGQLVCEPDISAIDFPLPRRLAAAGLRSMVLAPMMAESQVFGLLLAARKGPGAFTSADCEFLQQLTQHVALAAHQAQLHQALQRAYDDLRQSQQTVMQQERLRALGQMASGIAHDINNAISPVALYTEALLEREPNLSDRARKQLEIIQRAVDDVAQTVARMGEFYRMREPQVALVPVGLNKLVKQVIDLTRARWSDMAQQRGAAIDMRLSLGENLPPIAGVESQIRDALVNLVFNAVDAMPQGGPLTIRTRLDEGAGGQTVLLEVADSGIGMNEETKRRCLEPFFTTKGTRGTGLGLAMVYGVAQRHSATLDIESEPGKGTLVRLGFAAAPAEPAVASGTHKPPVGPMRILIVDDDPLLLKSLRDALESDGHEVTATNGGQSGINAFADSHAAGTPYPVVITDLGMPHVDGRKVASTVKATAPATVVLMLTGWGRRLVAEGDVPPGVDQVLSKPPKLTDLRSALAQHFSKK
ncbi:MAG TPA: PAS domain S-box protein [Steroidobacteraceae bacterium]|nr:PAS domain S-box protein [Steroidobacteraceae bacterium]